MDQDKRRKDLELRLSLTQDHNERMINMIEITKKMIQRARLERALLLEKLELLQSSNGALELELSPPASPSQEQVKQEEMPASESNQSQQTVSTPPHTSSQTKKPALKLPNAYNVFCREQRDVTVQLLRSQGQKSPKAQAVQRSLSDQWKLFSKDQKKLYTEKAKLIKENQKKENDGADETEQYEPETELNTEEHDQSDFDQHEDSQMEL